MCSVIGQTTCNDPPRRSPLKPLRLEELALWLTGAPFTLGIEGRALPSWATRASLAQEYADSELEYERLRSAGETHEALAPALRRRQASLDVILAAGLQRRCLPSQESEELGNPYGAEEDRAHPYGTRLESRSRELYQRLLEAGATPSHRVRVCQRCWFVFATRARPRAKKCPRCHGTKESRPTLKPWHFRAITVPTFNRLGDPLGWRIRYEGRCVECRGEYFSTRLDQRYCSPRCRVRAKRRRDAPVSA